MRSRFSLLLACVMLTGLLAACQSTGRQAAVPLPDVRVGVLDAVQPMGTTDLLAGYIPENRALATPEDLRVFDATLKDLLRAQSKRTIVSVPAGSGVDPTRNEGVRTALQHWVQVGRAHGVDLLIVPQILDWKVRQGSAAGVVSPAEVNLNFYLIDVREGGNLLQRSHFDERQQGLASNLLVLDEFIRRGGKWVTANELAKDGMLKMIKEFGL